MSSKAGWKSPTMPAPIPASLRTPPRSCGSTFLEGSDMAARRVILEMGTGNDLHGGDYTKAAVRAVQDAIHHSSLSLIRTLGLDPHVMAVEVTIGVQRPEKVDAAAVANALP